MYFILASIEECQSDPVFQQKSILFMVCDGEKTFEYYLPYIIAYKFKTKPESDIVYITASFDGFKQFIEDYIMQKKLLQIKSKLDIEKYIISKKLLDSFYEFEQDQHKFTLCDSHPYLQIPEYIRISVELILSYCATDYKYELLCKYISSLSSECIYVIEKHHKKIPIEIFQKKYIIIKPDCFYDTDILSKYEKITFSYEHSQRTGSYEGRSCYRTVITSYTTAIKYDCESCEYKILCPQKTFADSVKHSELDHQSILHHYGIGDRLSFSKDDIKSLGYYKKIMSLQQQPSFIEKDTTILTKIIDIKDDFCLIYLPSSVLKSLDQEYYEVMMSGKFKIEEYQTETFTKKIFCIQLTEDETIEDFKQYLSDYIDIDKPISKYIDITFDHTTDFGKYSIAYRMKQIYKIKVTGKKSFEIFDQLYHLDSYVSEEILRTVFRGELYVYDIVCKYPDVFSKLQVESTVLWLSSETEYKIEIILKFLSLQYSIYWFKIKEDTASRTWLVQIKKTTKTIYLKFDSACKYLKISKHGKLQLY